MTDRRTFVRGATGVALGALATPRFASAALARGELDRIAGERTPQQVAQDEAYWEVVHRAYTPDPGFINLEGGVLQPAADPVVEAQVRNIRRIN